MPGRKTLGVAALAAMLAACYPTASHRAAGRTAAVAAPPCGKDVYRIDPRRSQLQVLVYRAGAMASLGHDHVIGNAALSGWVELARPVGDSRFRLEVPVAAFVVDAADARRAVGGDFAAPVPAQARAATREHMLGADQLDAARHPTIVVSSLAISGVEPDLTARVAVRVAGRTAAITVPFVLARASGRLSATAAFDLRQTALGLTPYRVMLGALRVRDTIGVRVRLVAAQAGLSGPVRSGSACRPAP